MRPADVAACVDAFARELGFVYEVLLRHGVSDSDADDLVQEVFLVLWRRWGSYDHDRPLRAWLRGIAARVALKHRSREGARREIPGGLVDRPDEAPSAEEHIEAAARRSLLWSLLAELPDKQRNVLLLHEMAGISMREVADALEVPLKTAHTRLRTARIELDRRMRRLRAVGSPGPKRALAVLPALRRRGVGWGRPLRRVALAAAVAAGALVAYLQVDGRTEPVAMAPRATAASSTRAVQPLRRRNEALPASVVPVFSGWPAADSQPAGSVDPARLPGLVAHLGFDQLSSELVARDGSGRGNDCTIRGRRPKGVDWAPGLRGGGVDLNGYGWLECASSEALARLGSALTITAWVKRTGEREHRRSLVTWHYDPASLDYFQFGVRDERLFVRTRVDQPVVMAPAGPPRGRWAHVALTVSDDGTARFFLDGAGIHSAAIGRRERRGSASYPMLIGAVGNRLNTARAHEVMQALVDDVALYDRALGDDEIAALAAPTRPR